MGACSPSGWIPACLIVPMGQHLPAAHGMQWWGEHPASQGMATPGDVPVSHLQHCHSRDAPCHCQVMLTTQHPPRLSWSSAGCEQGWHRAGHVQGDGSSPVMYQAPAGS